MPVDRPWKYVTAVGAVAGLGVLAGSFGQGSSEAIAAIELDTVADVHPGVVVSDPATQDRARPVDDGGTLVSPIAPVERAGQVLSEASAPSPPEPADGAEGRHHDAGGAPTPLPDPVETPDEPVTASSETSVGSADD